MAIPIRVMACADGWIFSWEYVLRPDHRDAFATDIPVPPFHRCTFNCRFSCGQQISTIHGHRREAFEIRQPHLIREGAAKVIAASVNNLLQGELKALLVVAAGELVDRYRQRLQPAPEIRPPAPLDYGIFGMQLKPPIRSESAFRIYANASQVIAAPHFITWIIERRSHMSRATAKNQHLVPLWPDTYATCGRIHGADGRAVR